MNNAKYFGKSLGRTILLPSVVVALQLQAAPMVLVGPDSVSVGTSNGTTGVEPTNTNAVIISSDYNTGSSVKVSDDGISLNGATGAGITLSPGSGKNVTVDGDLSVTGTATFGAVSLGSATGAASTITSGTSITQRVVDATGESNIVLSPTEARFLVYNIDTKENHGLIVGKERTLLTGGTQGTSLQLDDTGATFSNSATGAPARVTGIANGLQDYDAVNRGQLNQAFGGVASVAALAALPPPAPNRHFTLGVGAGHYQGESGIALGLKGSLTDSSQFTLGTSWNSSDADAVVNGGFSLSW